MYSKKIMLHLFNDNEKHPYVAVILTVMLLIALFLSAITAGENIGDAIWG